MLMPLAVAALLLGKPLLTALGGRLPPCTFRLFTGLLCPGCGNTHAVLALLEGNVLTSLFYNPFPLCLAVFLLLFYTEVALRLFHRQVRLFPRSLAFWLTFVGLFLAYALLRNVIPALHPF